MSRNLTFGERLLPALLVAAAVALLAAGMVAWLDPGVGGRGGVAAVDPQATDPLDGDPMGDGLEPPGTAGPEVVTTPRATERPEPTPRPTEHATERPERTARPTAGPTPEPTVATPATPLPAPTAQPAPPEPAPTAQPTPAPTPDQPKPPPTPSPTPEPDPTAQPTQAPTQAPSVEPAEPVVATRIVIASRDIDLPIISREKRVKGQGPDKYPPCDVALYHTAFEQPGQPGTTYIYAHAREGMFLPLLDASTRRNGASLIGALVQVYTSDEREHVYQITRVKRHALDFSLALDAPPDAHQLIMQTSEGPRGTVPKLQVLAELVDVLPVSAREANPKPRPRPCYDTP